LKTNEVRAKSILQKSGIPGADYVINPYTGCTHACVYCYAKFMKRFTGHKEPWGTFLDAKVNATELLKNQLNKKKKPFNNRVFLSSVTDPYNPSEKKYKITRNILKILLEHQVPVSILTKSDLVIRDLDLFNKFDDCSIGLSMMSTSAEISRQFEPRAPVPEKRIEALNKLKINGIYTYAFISPYLPGISDIEIIFKTIEGAVDEIGIEAFNPRGANWSGVKEVLSKSHPDLLSDFRKMILDDFFWDNLEAQAVHHTAQSGISFMGLFRH